jgi:hypothetical protein
VYQLFTDCKKSYDSVRREVLYNIFIEFNIPVELVMLIKMCLNETYSKVHKHFSDAFPIKNGLKQGDASLPLLANFALEYAVRKVQENKDGTGIDWDTSASGDINLLGENKYHKDGHRCCIRC